ncbi:hypothetical protein OU798_07525 [Prolixibacteraceae bacterium Z1-6]|uniref:Uncharacterized protein n=1 Tax=Draconibacterium aestuarii TaxID=2998507 RepID=A0A9X3F5K4_9BACT|nr:hypothetical protein [Prolixibacteraceae bacterium Z1-6]
METVNSLSGGKTSSYIAVHYPADYDVFALCCIDSHNAGAHIDRKMKQRVNDKLQKYCPHMPEFVATSEDPVLLKTMFDLEQKIGREIIWLRGIGWEEMLRVKKAIPNMDKRFCTTILKMQPIFEFLFMRVPLPVKMRIGFRYDEAHRVNSENTTFRFPKFAKKYKGRLVKSFNKSTVTFETYFFDWLYQWETIEWRVNEHPLVDDKIIHYAVAQYWDRQNIVFPDDSNCQNCFWKDEQQLRKNFDTNLPIMIWAAIQEHLWGNTFKEEYSLFQISEMPIQLDFTFGTGAGCQAGFCTN